MKFVFYSHFDYSDIWPVLFGQCEKYLDKYEKVLFTNEGSAPKGWEVITYDDALPYQQRVTSCLDQLEEEVIVFNHEDMIPYSSVDCDKLKDFHKLVQEDEVQFIKLLRGGYTDELLLSEYHPNLLECSPPMIFTIQPTICKVEHLLSMYKETPGNSIWEFESQTALTAIKNSYKGCMAYKEGDPKRGMHYWDSSIYPYIATAIVKGKWYTSDYPELVSMLKDYNIEVSLRGEG